MRNENTKEGQVQPAAFVGQVEGAELWQSLSAVSLHQSTHALLLQPKQCSLVASL